MAAQEPSPVRRKRRSDSRAASVISTVPVQVAEHTVAADSWWPAANPLLYGKLIFGTPMDEFLFWTQLQGIKLTKDDVAAKILALSAWAGVQNLPVADFNGAHVNIRSHFQFTLNWYACLNMKKDLQQHNSKYLWPWTYDGRELFGPNELFAYGTRRAQTPDDVWPLAMIQGGAQATESSDALRKLNQIAEFGAFRVEASSKVCF